MVVFLSLRCSLVQMEVAGWPSPLELTVSSSLILLMTLVYLEFLGAGALFTLGNCPDSGSIPCNLIFWYHSYQLLSVKLISCGGDCDVSQSLFMSPNISTPEILSEEQSCRVTTFKLNLITQFDQSLKPFFEFLSCRKIQSPLTPFISTPILLPHLHHPPPVHLLFFSL